VLPEGIRNEAVAINHVKKTEMANYMPERAEGLADGYSG
jgi:hypothetical protein